MRNGQNKRMRGRGGGGGGGGGHNNRKGQNPLTRVYESNGPDVKIRGNPAHIADKYLQLARDAQSSGDPVSAENYFQHAEHYFRLIAAAQEQFRQSQPQFYRPENPAQSDDPSFDDGDDDGSSQPNVGEPFSAGSPQPYVPRDSQPPYPPRDPQYQPQPRTQHQHPQHQGDGSAGDVGGLPSFITGGQQPPQAQHGGMPNNGYDSNQPDRFPLHRRRRRHRGHRPEMGGGQEQPSGRGDHD